MLQLLPCERRRLLLVGNWGWDIYEEALSRGLTACGIDVFKFNTQKYKIQKTNMILKTKYTGQSIRNINRELINFAINIKPDIIFLWRAVEILPRTVLNLRSMLPCVRIIAYHNDNPYIGFCSKIVNT